MASVLENVRMAERTYRIRLHVPDIAARIRPGQFVMLRIPGTSDPLLGRPFALYDTVLDPDARPIGIDVVYLVVGKLTAHLAELTSTDPIEVWGPLGNGFLNLGPQEHVTLVAGGIGQTPFLAYVRQLLGKRGYGGSPSQQTVQRIFLYYGVRSAPLAAGIDDFRRAGAEVHLASEDGSIGTRGFVTRLLEEQRPPGPIVGCGPEPMLHAVSSLAAAWGTTCHVSLETPMACGFGVCFSCVTRVSVGAGWDYRRVCVDGPVFDAAHLVWNDQQLSGDSTCRS
jgi:dihydroorotate dehydrogenase electron transfer subunit